MELYKRIRSRREELGMSQEELAKKMGYKSRSSINKIEMGENDIPQSKIVAFAKALDTTPAYLMGLENKKNINEVLAENIKKYRISWGVSKSDVANYVGLSEKEIEDYENGKLIPALEELIKLSSAFNISVEKLLSLPENTDDDIQQLYIANKFSENGYIALKTQVGEREQIWITDGEKYYEIDVATFNAFVASIDNYIAFNIRNMLSKAEPKYYKNKESHDLVLNAASARPDATDTDTTQTDAVMKNDSEWE